MTLPKLLTAITNNRFLVASFVFIFFIFVNANILTRKVSAAGLYLNPATGSILTSTFELTASLDVEQSTTIKGMDAYITFDPTLVQVDRIDKIGLNTATSTATYNNSLGTIHIKGDFSQTPATGSILNFAKIYLSVKPNTKGKAVSFTFEEGVDKTSVSDTTNVSALSRTVGSDLLIDVTTSGTVNQSTSTSVPKTGDTDTTYLIFLIIGGILTASYSIRKYAFTKL